MCTPRSDATWRAAYIRSGYGRSTASLRKPDLALYFRVPIEVSLERLLTGRAKLKYHEAGMDVGLSRDPAESFRLFQSRVLEIYDGLVDEFGLRVIDATGDIHNQQLLVRRMARDTLRGFRGTVADLGISEIA